MTDTTSFVSLDSGFKITSGSFSYTPTQADVGKTDFLSWGGGRDFQVETAGNYVTTTTLSGSLTLPAGIAVTSFQVYSIVADDSTKATVDLGAFAGGNFSQSATSEAYSLTPQPPNQQSLLPRCFSSARCSSPWPKRPSAKRSR